MTLCRRMKDKVIIITGNPLSRVTSSKTHTDHNLCRRKLCPRHRPCRRPPLRRHRSDRNLPLRPDDHEPPHAQARARLALPLGVDRNPPLRRQLRGPSRGRLRRRPHEIRPPRRHVRQRGHGEREAVPGPHRGRVHDNDAREPALGVPMRKTRRPLHARHVCRQAAPARQHRGDGIVGGAAVQRWAERLQRVQGGGSESGADHGVSAGGHGHPHERAVPRDHRDGDDGANVPVCEGEGDGGEDWAVESVEERGRRG